MESYYVHTASAHEICLVCINRFGLTAVDCTIIIYQECILKIYTSTNSKFGLLLQNHVNHSSSSFEDLVEFCIKYRGYDRPVTKTTKSVSFPLLVYTLDLFLLEFIYALYKQYLSELSFFKKYNLKYYLRNNYILLIFCVS